MGEVKPPPIFYKYTLTLSAGCKYVSFFETLHDKGIIHENKSQS